MTVAATFVAAGAMAYSTGGGQQHHQDEAPTRFHVASNGGTYGAGDVVLETQQTDPGDGGGGSDPGVGTGGPGVGSDPVTGGAPHGLYGPGDGHDGPPSSNFMPNGENGLMTLASYAAGQSGGQNSNNNSDHTPGGPHDGGAPNGGSNPFTGSSAGGDGSSKIAGPGGDSGSGSGSNSNSNSGPGDGGAGGAGGFGSGGGGGGGFLSNGTGSTGTGGSNGSGPTDGGSTPPVNGGLPPITSPPTNNDPTNGNSGDGGGKLCIVTATNLCDGTPGLVGLPGFAAPVDQPGGGGPPDGPIPEPAGWMTMILGFGALGLALRARRRARAALV